MAQTKNPLWGIIDVGSNTFRLCVYELGEKGSYEERANAKSALGLASYLTPQGELQQDGIDKACKALTKLVRMAQLMGCSEVSIFATAAVRNCSNSKSVVEQLEAACGEKIEVISGADEACLSLEGARESVELSTGLFFDIGGGSTELMSLVDGEMQANESIRLGSLNAWSRYCTQILPQRYELELLAVEVGRQLDKQQVQLIEHCTACGIGGTMRFALKIAKLLGAECKGRELSQADIELIFNTLDRDPNRLARLMLQQNPARVHTLLPGCTIARELIHRLDCNSVVVAKTGVREGYLKRKIQRQRKGR